MTLYVSISSHVHTPEKSSKSDLPGGMLLLNIFCMNETNTQKYKLQTVKVTTNNQKPLNCIPHLLSGCY